MNTIQESTSALDAILASICREELTQIIEEIDNIEAVGPTVFEYFEHFDSQFQNFYSNEINWLEQTSSYLHSLKYPYKRDVRDIIFEVKINKPLKCDIEFEVDIEGLSSIEDYYIAA